MLTLYGHPISSFTWKALIALYENDTPFDFVTVDQDTFADFKAMWPLAKFPVLRDSDRDVMITESSCVIEYLDLHHPGRTRFLPNNADQALEVRRWDGVFDNYVMTPMSKVVSERFRPAGQTDAFGAEQARTLLRTAYDVIEHQLGERAFIVGDSFTMADCAAAPSLWYAARNVPLGEGHPRVGAYLERLKQRPSFIRTLKQSEPLFHMYPGD